MQVKDKQLIPSAFQIADGSHMSLTDLMTAVKNKLTSKGFGLTSGVQKACLHILNESAKGNSSFAHDQGTLTDQEYNIILKDFGEISGAAYMLKTESSKYKAVTFPTGNEKLVDYVMVTKNGLKESYSAKAGQGGKPSIVSVMPIFEQMVRNNQLDNKYKTATWVLYHLGKEQTNALYLGPLQAAEHLNTKGYQALLALLKDKSLKTGYVSGIPTDKHLEAAVVNCGNYENFIKVTKKYYDAAGYSNNINVEVTKRILGKTYDRKRYGLLHYPITAELVKWLNTDANHAKDLLTKAANTLSVTQIYLDKKGQNLQYTVKGFSEAEFSFGSPSSAPYPTNNRIGFTMKKTPQPKG